MARPHAFSSDRTAVSPVIGVMVLVAITATLALVVFALVSTTKDKPPEEKAASFLKDDGADRVAVVRADPEMDWSSYSVHADTLVRSALNTEAGLLTGTPITPGTYTPITGTPTAVTANDFLEFCAVGGPAQDVWILVRNDATNRLYACFSYTAIDACA